MFSKIMMSSVIISKLGVLASCWLLTLQLVTGQNLYGFPMGAAAGMMNGYGGGFGGGGYAGGYGNFYGMGANMGLAGSGLGMGAYGRMAGGQQYPYVDPQVYWLLASAPANQPAQMRTILSISLLLTVINICF